MIVAYCDSCDAKIEPETPAGVRYVFGRKEFSGHLCPPCMKDAENAAHELHGIHVLRKVK